DAWIYEARSGSTPASLNYSNENRHVGGSCRLQCITITGGSAVYAIAASGSETVPFLDVY
ncbi:hypothetical protein, partial [Rhodoblastus sphagnicola]